MGLISADRFIALKAEVKAECLRRCYTGSVASYGGTKYDYTNTPATNSIIFKEHYEKNAIPLNAISGDIQINGRIIKDSDLTTMENKVSELKKIGKTATETGCAASCTGLCYSCTGTCSTGCSGDCSGDCSGHCDGFCVDTCEELCTGTCTVHCASTCSNDCSGGCEGTNSGTESCLGTCVAHCEEGGEIPF